MDNMWYFYSFGPVDFFEGLISVNVNHPVVSAMIRSVEGSNFKADWLRSPNCVWCLPVLSPDEVSVMHGLLWKLDANGTCKALVPEPFPDRWTMYFEGTVYIPRIETFIEGLPTGSTRFWFDPEEHAFRHNVLFPSSN